MPPEGRVITLFDMEADPDEFYSLADNPDHADTIKALLTRLAEWYRRIPPKNKSPRADLKGKPFLDWAIAPRNIPKPRNEPTSK